MDETDIDLRSIVGVLRRQLRIILITIGLVIGAAAIGVLVLTPIYSATALILVDPRTKDLLNPDSGFANTGADSARIDSEAEILRSDSTLLRVIQAEELVHDAEFGPALTWQARLAAWFGAGEPQLPTGQAAFNDTLAHLRSAITVQRRGNTYLIGVQARSTSPAKAAMLANALAAVYIEAQLNAKIASVLASRDIVRSRADQARAALAHEEQAFKSAGGEALPADSLRADLARNQYQTLLSRVQELDAQAALQLADTRIVSPALAPQFASFPDRRLVLPLAALLGLGLGVALAFLYENLIGGFHSEEQAEAVLRTRVAAAIPRPTPRPSQASLADLMISEPLSSFAEAVRRIRVGFHFPSARRDQKDHSSLVVMVSSTAPNEGKTTVALALARSFALSGKSTLIVDCDLRKPALHRHLSVEKSIGLTEHLENAGAGDLISTLTSDPLTELTAIVGAQRSTIPTDQLLAGQRFELLIEAARRSFDVIILDTPPIGPVVDALYLAPFADAIVFLTKWSSTPQADIKRAMDSLRETARPEAEIVSVLNQLQETRSPYYRKYGRYLAQAS